MRSGIWGVGIIILCMSGLVSAAPPEGSGYGWKLVFEDNFDGTSLDTIKWGYNYTWGTTHNHAANMQSSQVTLSDGKLVLTAENRRSIWDPWGTTVDGVYWPYDYTSGAIYSKSWFYQGYFEGSLKLPGGIGTWPAFWMLKSGWPPEIDIMENPCYSSDVIDRYHYYYHYYNGTSNTSFGTYYNASGLSTAYHTYGCEWTSTQMAFYYDNSQRGRWTSSYLPGSSMYLILNLAIGGWGGTPNLTSTGWTYNSSTGYYNATYNADWVRVWQRKQDTIKECIGWWKLDETSGTSAADNAGKSMTGTLNGGMTFAANSVAGRQGRALSFDGTDDYISLPGGFSEFDNGMTFTVWAYPTAVKNWARFLDLGQGQGNDNILLARESTTNTLIFQGWGGSADGSYVRATSAIELNKWQFFAVTIDTSGNVVIYKNGSAVATGTSTWPWGVTRTNNYIGKSNWSADSYYQGYMDDIRVFDYAMTAAEISTVYTLVMPYSPSPVDIGTGVTAQVLSWLPGMYGETAWQVYFGTNLTSVTNATTAGAEYQGIRYEPKFTPSVLSSSTTYYWRVDPLLSDGTVPKNSVWTFTTGTWSSTPLGPKFTGYAITRPDAVEGVAYSQSLSDTMVYTGTHLFTKLGGPDWIEISSDGQITGTPPEGSAGQNDCTVRVSNASDVSDEARITITVKDTYSGRRGIDDFLAFAQEWLYEGTEFNSADLDQNGRVDMSDFRQFAGQWLAELEPGLVAEWDFNNADGQTVFDLAGFHTGTTQNMNTSWRPLATIAGETNHCLLFDGVDDYVEIPEYYGIGGTSARTVSLWVKTSASGTMVQWGSDTIGQLWLMRVEADGTVLTATYGGGVHSTASVADGQWHHIAAVLDAGQTDSSQIQLYIDGILDATATTGVCTAQTVPVHLGAWYQYGTSTRTNYLQGSLDDVRIYSRVLTDAEIAVLAQ